MESAGQPHLCQAIHADREVLGLPCRDLCQGYAEGLVDGGGHVLSVMTRVCSERDDRAGTWRQVTGIVVFGEQIGAFFGIYECNAEKYTGPVLTKTRRCLTMKI